jgi:hypothetical protein
MEKMFLMSTPTITKTAHHSVCRIADLLALDVEQSLSFPIAYYWVVNGTRQRAEFKTMAERDVYGNPRKFKISKDDKTMQVVITRTI